TMSALPFTSTVAVGTTAPDVSVTIPVIFPVVDTCAKQIPNELATNNAIPSRVSRLLPKPYTRRRVMTGLPNLIPQLTDAGGKGEWILHTIWSLCQPKKIGRPGVCFTLAIPSNDACSATGAIDP